MRILFVTRKFPPSMGGMEIFSQQLYAALKRQHPEIEVYVPTPPIRGRPTLRQLLRFYVGSVFHIFRARRTTDILLLGDTLLTPLALFARLFSRGRIEVVGTAHGNDIFFALRGSFASRLYRLTLVCFAGMERLLIANSQYTAGLASTIGFKNVSVVPLATTLPAVPPRVSPQPFILFAGRLIHTKGLSWFIEKVLPLVDARLSLVVAGPPWDEGEMRAVEECDRANYVGVLEPEALAELRASATACIMPNLPPQASNQGEGFGLSALESPAVGVPVIVSRCGGLVEAVVEGVTGFLVEPLMACAFAERINDVVLWPPDKRREFAAHARQAIAERFTWDRVGRDYLDLLAPICRC